MTSPESLFRVARWLTFASAAAILFGIAYSQSLLALGFVARVVRAGDVRPDDAGGVSLLFPRGAQAHVGVDSLCAPDGRRGSACGDAGGLDRDGARNSLAHVVLEALDGRGRAGRRGAG